MRNSKSLIRTFKTSIIAGALAFGGTAHAADLYGAPEQSYKDVTPVLYNWSGFYAGLNAGFGVGDTEESVAATAPGPTPLLFNFDYGVQGPIFGGQIGWNGQSGTFVYGLEATFDGTDMDTSEANCGLFVNCRRDLDWFGTVEARLGYAVDKTLFYIRGGWAYGRVKTDVNIVTPVALGGGIIPAGSSLAGISGKETFTGGWTAGVGLEHAFTQSFSVGVEYAHVDLGDEASALGVNFNPAFGPVPAFGVTDRVDLEFDTFKIRANWRFNTFGF